MASRRLIWIPRTLVAFFAVFLSLFALDAVPSTFSPMGIAGLLIHLGPAFLLVGILLGAWNRPRLAGVCCLVLSAVFTVFFKTYRSAPTFLAISGPPFLAGILFVAFSLGKIGTAPRP